MPLEDELHPWAAVAIDVGIAAAVSTAGYEEPHFLEGLVFTPELGLWGREEVVVVGLAVEGAGKVLDAIAAVALEAGTVEVEASVAWVSVGGEGKEAVAEGSGGAFPA